MTEITQKEARELWARDLEEHPDLQGHGRLATNDVRFCCLGRLCVIAREHGVALPEYWDQEVNLRYDGFEPVRDWVGLRTAEGDFETACDSRNSLVRCNDGIWDDGSDTMDFLAIAAIIRSEPNGLFDD